MKKFNGKMGQIFYICLRSGPRGLTNPPLYGLPDRKKTFFWRLPYYQHVKYYNITFVIFRLAMFVFHTLVNCSALAFFIFSRLKLVPPSAERSVHDHQIHYLRKRWRHNKHNQIIQGSGKTNLIFLGIFPKVVTPPPFDTFRKVLKPTVSREISAIFLES